MSSNEAILMFTSPPSTIAAARTAAESLGSATASMTSPSAD